MHIAYSMADQVFEKSASVGIYRISLGLLNSLARDPAVDKLTVFTNSSIPQHCIPSSALSICCDIPSKNMLGRIWWDQYGVFRKARQVGCDWLFLPKGFASFLVRPVPRLATFIHDTMPTFYADRYPGSISRMQQKYFSLCCSSSVRNADIVFTNTDFTKTEIESWAAKRRAPCCRIAVAGYGFAQPENNCDRKEQILVDVRKAPHKRTDLALQYLRQWVDSSSYEGTIVCVGSLPDGVSLPDGNNWYFVGRVPPEECEALMGRSKVVVQFSEYEGFGMPAVEAVLVGACPVYSELPPTKEVMGDAGYSFCNTDYSSFAEAMSQALSTSPEQVAQWADQLMERHNWDNVCSVILTQLRELSK